VLINMVVAKEMMITLIDEDDDLIKSW
jgi:hypothetical protein